MKGAKTQRTGREIECRFRFCMLATYSSYGACWTELGAVFWQPTALMGHVGRSLGAVCWQPTALMGHVGRSLGLYVGNLQVLWSMLDGVWGCMLATYRSYGACWTEFGAVCWQPTTLMGHVGRSLGLYVGNLLALMGHVGRSLGLYVGNLQLLWGMLDGAWGCMLATYRSFGACWTELGAVCWHLWGMLDGACGCMLATCWKELGAIRWQPAALMGHVGRSLGLYVGNLQVFWGMLDGVWGCMLATYSSYGACWTELGAVCWQPTCLLGHVGRSLGLYVGNLLDGDWRCMLATYSSYGRSLGLYVGNLQLLWGMLDGAWGSMLATYRSLGACWTEFGAVCWQPTALMGHVGRSLGLYVGNLHVFWGMLDGVWGCMLATCWTEIGAVCWQPTALMGGAWGYTLATCSSYGACWTELGALCWQPTGLLGHVGRSLGLYLATYSSYGACWTELGAVCWQPTSVMGHVGRSLGLYVGNLQLLWGMLDGAWGCMLATYRSYGACWTELGAVCWQPTALMTEFGAVCWQPTGLMGHVGRTWGCILAT